MHRVADETLESLRDRLLGANRRRGVRHQLAEFVTGRAMHRPVATQRLVAREDFLDQQDKWRGHPPAAKVPSAAAASRCSFSKYSRRQIKPVRVIDAHTGDRALRDQLQQEPVGSIEDLRQFHPDRREIVHVEEAPVIDLLGRHAPEGEAIRLIVQQSIEHDRNCADRPAVPLIFSPPARSRRLHRRRFLAAPLEPALDDLLLARAFRDRAPDRSRSGAANIRAR